MAAFGPYWVGDRPRDQVDVLLVREGNVPNLSGYTTATIALTDPDGLPVDITGTNVVLGADRVSIDWPSDRSIFAKAGYHLLQIALTGDGIVDHTQVLTFEVYELNGSNGHSWASQRDVLTYTGMNVDPSTVMQAQGVIELHTGTSYAATTPANGFRLRARDARLLRQAVSYQAAFMATQESTFSRAGMASVSQDGLSLNTGGDTDAWTLAPLAKTALAQVSWRNGDRTTKIAKARHRGDDEGDVGATPWIPTQQFIAGRRY